MQLLNFKLVLVVKHMLFSGLGWDKPLLSFNIIHQLTVFHMELLDFGIATEEQILLLVKQQLNKLSKTILLINSTDN